MGETGPKKPEFTEEELEAIFSAALEVAADPRTPIERASVLVRVADKIHPEDEL